MKNKKLMNFITVVLITISNTLMSQTNKSQWVEYAAGKLSALEYAQYSPEVNISLPYFIKVLDDKQYLLIVAIESTPHDPVRTVVDYGPPESVVEIEYPNMKIHAYKTTAKELGVDMEQNVILRKLDRNMMPPEEFERKNRELWDSDEKYSVLLSQLLEKEWLLKPGKEHEMKALAKELKECLEKMTNKNYLPFMKILAPDYIAWIEKYAGPLFQESSPKPSK
ncbi:hypothetical protein QQ054_11025 [Oscillatoria amoena NRMC-F 0135]|nr:hypothetical protein [Oscillatoria laete-virens]MDL5046565.1 hypothetical protein [Oscillatoria amoena NRMC-F 0135]MDL5054818.1 hypothetical protein [Oscillatoria laete-virens NRMC-F 0139]